MSYFVLRGLLLPLLIWLGATGHVEASLTEVEPPRDLTPAEKALLEDGQDGQFHTLSLLQAALIAEQCEDKRIWEACQLKIDHVLANLPDEAATERETSSAPLSQVIRTFDLLHEQLLTGHYRAERTSVHGAIEDGNYNCVSATVLFHELCRRQCIPVTALTTPTHVFSQVELDGQVWYVQTTCRKWFQLTAEERQAMNAERTASARIISDCALIAKIYYNHGVYALERHQFAQAERCFRMALVLDREDTAAEENLLATWNNWALDLCDNGNYREAIARLETGKRHRRDYPPFAKNHLHIIQRWAQSLCHQGHYAEALQLLHDNRGLEPQAALFADGPAIIYRLWADSLIRQGNHHHAQQLLDEALRAYPTSAILRLERQRLLSVTGR